MQMRAVAERADVALGTLYRYFPSKIHLLVGALTEEFERIQEKLDRKPIPGDDALPTGCCTCWAGSPGPCSASRCSPRR